MNIEFYFTQNLKFQILSSLWLFIYLFIFWERPYHWLPLWQKCMKLDILNIKFYVELDFHNIEFQKGGILLLSLQTVVFDYIVFS